MREESDGIGNRKIPAESLKGIHTLRGEENFPVKIGLPFPELIHALFQVKLACLETNFQLNYLTKPIYETCHAAISEGLTGALNALFDITMFQGGAGTSLNMSTNEIIANRALEIAGHRPGEYGIIHPILHVNLHQSTNDVIPTAGRVAVISASRKLETAVLGLQEAMQEKEREFDHLVKPGRTQFQDAFPITLGREFSAYASALARDRWRIFKLTERLREVNLGGTAIGTGVLAPRTYIFRVTEELKRITGFPLARSENLVDGTQNADTWIEAHGFLSTLATTLIKVAGDLRLMSSGPDHGLGEVEMPAVQAGSSIMPGKVNPVIPEYVTSCALRVQANQQMLMSAGAMGSLELNPFVPLIIHGLLESVTLLTAAATQFSLCISGLNARKDRLKAGLRSDGMLTHVLAGKFGYERAQEIFEAAREAKLSVEAYILKNEVMSSEALDQLLSPENVLKLGF